MARVSEYRERVTFTRTVQEQNALTGDMNPTTTTVVTTWAKVRPLKGIRGFEVGQLLTGKPFLIYIRGRKDEVIDEKLQILWKGQKLTIQSVNPTDAFGDELEILAYQVK
jgi:SPP1 family predicted phage head-tail adaptor